MNADLKLYHYTKGRAFGPHIDEPVVEGSYRSEFTVLMYIVADGLKGGQTVFHTRPPIAVECVPGRVLLHYTGRNCLHSGAPVEKGTKMLLRTDLFFKRE